MLNRDRILRSAIRKVGMVYDYAENITQTTAVFEDVFDTVLRTIASRVDLRFNSRLVKLEKNVNTSNKFGEIRYNKPVDFLNKINFRNGNGRIENEFIYSNDEDLYLLYCSHITLSEIPDYMEELLTIMVAVAIAEAHTQFADRIGILEARYQNELKQIYTIEYQPVVRVV